METEKELARASMGRSRSPYIASQSFLTQLKKTLFHEETKKRFEMMLGEYAPSFMQSILSATTNNKLLMKADPAPPAQPHEFLRLFELIQRSRLEQQR